MKQLTQDFFNGAPDWVKSAAVNKDGSAYLYENRANRLVASSGRGIFLVTGFNRGWLAVGEYDATDWRNSAIDREVSK